MNTIEIQAHQDEIIVKLFDIAFQTAQTIEDDYDKIEALSDIARAYYQVDYKDKALNILAIAVNKINQIGSDSTKAFLLNKIAGHYIKIDRGNHALLILESALLLLNKIEPSDSRDYIIIDIAFNYALVGHYEKSLAVAQLVEDEWKKVSKFFTDLIWYYVEAGKHDRVQEIIHNFKGDLWLLEEAAISYAQRGECQRAIQINNEIVDQQSKSLTLIAIGDRYIDDGEVEKAIEILQQAQNLASNLEKNQAKSWLLDIIAKKYAKAGRKDLAKQILPQSMSFNQIAYSLIAAKEYAEAIQLTESKAQNFTVLEKIRIYINIADEYLKNQDTEKALSLANKALQAAENLDSKIAKIEVTTSIAAIYAQTQDKERAVEILNSAAQIAKVLENKIVIGSELRNIANQYGELGYLENALKIAKLIVDDRDRVKTFAEIAVKYAFFPQKNGDPAKQKVPQELER
jgi:tetratricopeptide (TPR) repeat protein